MKSAVQIKIVADTSAADKAFRQLYRAFFWFRVRLWFSGIVKKLRAFRRKHLPTTAEVTADFFKGK